MRALLAIDGESQYDAVICDPPYFLESVTKRFGKPGSALAQEGSDGRFRRASRGFMGHGWDGADADGRRVAFEPETWELCLRLLKPGGFCLAFASPRTGHWQAVAMDQAGFIMHPHIGWVYGQGMPKGHSVSRDIDKIVGTTGSQGEYRSERHSKGNIRSNNKDLDPGYQRPWMDDPEAVERNLRQYLPGSSEDKEWDGWYSGAGAIKPALEPIYIGQRPRSEKTDAANILKHGVGAYNIDDCRIPPSNQADIDAQMRVAGFNKSYSHGEPSNSYSGGLYGSLHKRDRTEFDPAKGRWPANLIHDGSPEVEALFPGSAGQLARAKDDGSPKSGEVYGKYKQHTVNPEPRNDSGSASRFFMNPIVYVPKASSAERKTFYTIDAEGRKIGHPTTKPQWLIEYLMRLVVPDGGYVMDPFAGSGTAGAAALSLGFRCDLIEADPDYVVALLRRFSDIRK